MKIFNNEKGHSLIELVVSLPLAILVFAGLITAVSYFITNYQEVRLYTELQQKVVETIDVIRHGYIKKNVNDDEGLIGLLTAKEIKFSPEGAANSSSIYLKPIIVEPGLNYFSKFYLDSEGLLRVNGRYGLSYYNNELVFPDNERMVGNEYQFQIINDDIFIDESTDGMKGLVGIHIKARVRYREREAGQSTEEDLEKNTDTIDYKTSVYVGNM